MTKQEKELLMMYQRLNKADRKELKQFARWLLGEEQKDHYRALQSV